MTFGGLFQQPLNPNDNGRGFHAVQSTILECAIMHNHPSWLKGAL
jgi:hypothetical protein